MLQQIATHNTVKLIWLPGHAGIYGNEVADRLADQAARRPTVGPEPLTAINYKLIRDTNAKWLYSQLAQMWNNVQGCSHTKCFVNQADPSITKQILNMSKQNIRIVIGLLAGHCKVNQHLAHLRLRDDPDCDLCGMTNETAKHIVCDCVGTANTRHDIYGKAIVMPREMANFR